MRRAEKLANEGLEFRRKAFVSLPVIWARSKCFYRTPQRAKECKEERDARSANEAFYSKLFYAESYAVGRQMVQKTGAVARFIGVGRGLLWMDIFVAMRSGGNGVGWALLTLKVEHQCEPRHSYILESYVI